jgi:hypothetical protein
MNIGIKTLSAQDLRETGLVQKEAIGSIGVSRDGHVYQYGKAEGAVASGLLAVAEAVVANHTNRTVADSVAVGGDEITVNIGATAAAQDLYADGFLVVNDAAGEGVAYKIAGNSAGAGSDVVRVRLYDPVTKALTVSVSEVSLIKHPAMDCAVSTTLAKAVGVANVDVADEGFAYFQKTGVCSVLADGAPAKNNRVIQSNGTAGAVEVQVETDIIETVGVALETLTTTEHRAVVLSIA